MKRGHTLIVNHLRDIEKPISAKEIASKLNISTMFTSQALRDLARSNTVIIDTESAGPAYHTYKLV